MEHELVPPAFPRQGQKVVSLAEVGEDPSSRLLQPRPLILEPNLYASPLQLEFRCQLIQFRAAYACIEPKFAPEMVQLLGCGIRSISRDPWLSAALLLRLSFRPRRHSNFPGVWLDENLDRI